MSDVAEDAFFEMGLFLLVPATCLALVLLVAAPEDLNPKKRELAMKVAAKKLVLGRDREVFVADAKQARETVLASRAAEAKRQESARKNNAFLAEPREQLDASNVRNLNLPIHDAAKKAAEVAKQAKEDELRVEKLEQLQQIIVELTTCTEQVRKVVDSILPEEPSADTALANTSSSSPNSGPTFSSGRRCVGLLVSDFKWQPRLGMGCSRSDNATNSKPDSPSDAGVNLDEVGPKRTGELLSHDWSYCARRCHPLM